MNQFIEEQERMERELEALCEVYRTGLEDTATFLASELGLSQQFKQEIERGIAS